MGWTVAEVKAASVFEFSAAMVGWSKQHEDSRQMSEADKDDVWTWLQAKDDVPLSFREARRRRGNGAAKVTTREAL